MKRSEINEILAGAEAMMEAFRIVLPPFGYLAPEALARDMAGPAADVFEARLGWDVTDYGLGDFAGQGLTLFTLRNGRAGDLSAGRGRLYAEKLLISQPGQVAPMHTHVVKAEDIINRGGGRLVIELQASRTDGRPDPDAPVTVLCDGRWRRLDRGGRIALEPGESVTLMPGDWHAFWAEGEAVMIGEVSTVNDDETDNIFREPIARFATVEEDAPPRRLLVSDYAAFMGG